MGDLHCVECRAQAKELFKDYGKGIIKIAHCDKCHNVVDKYIEYEPMVIFVDTVLLKYQAYMHLLYNIDLKHLHWKLCVIYILCDTYLKWDQLFANRHPDKNMDDHIFYAVLEYQFYMCFLISLLEFFAFIALLVCYTSIRKRNTDINRIEQLVRGLLVSSYGKLLAIPAIIWGQTHSATILMLTKLFIMSSNAAVVNVVSNLRKKELLLVLVVAAFIQTLLSDHLKYYLLPKYSQ